MKDQHALFFKDLTTWFTEGSFNGMMDIINMLPEIILFLKYFSSQINHLSVCFTVDINEVYF